MYHTYDHGRGLLVFCMCVRVLVWASVCVRMRVYVYTLQTDVIKLALHCPYAYRIHLIQINKPFVSASQGVINVTD